MKIKNLLLLALCLQFSNANAESPRRTDALSKKIDRLIEPEQLDATGILFVDLNSGERIYEVNSHLPMKPASVMKLITSNSAMRRLGPDFTWKTRVSIDGLKNGRAAAVAIKGSGDPSLTSESLWQLSRQIYKAGVRQIDNLILDDSAFIDQRVRTGGRAFEGGVSALAFNFNSLGFSACPTSAGKPALVSVDPWEIETKLSGKVMTVARQGEPVLVDDRSSCGSDGCTLGFELGGTVAYDSPCIELFRSVERPKEYLAKVWIKFLRALGISGTFKIQYNPAPQKPELFFDHSSVPLRQVLIGLNNFSTNVTADQLIYAIGMQDDGEFSFQQGIKRIGEDLERADQDRGQFNVVDGSGLSHDNRLTATAIVKVLSQQFENIEYGLEYQASLAIWGRSGTLKKRAPLPQGVVVRGKTGSLDGVSTVAGYLFRPEKAPIAFAILQNRVATKAKAADIEDRIIELVSLSQ